MLVKIAQGTLRTHYGTYHEHLYYNGQTESIAMVLGDVSGADDVLCRVHSSCIFGHYFHSAECDCREQMEVSQQLIQRAGRGVLILLQQEGKGNGHFALLNSVAFKRQGLAQGDAYEAVGFKKDARDFRVAAEMLADLGVQSVRMLTNNPDKVDTLTRHGVVVSGVATIAL